MSAVQRTGASGVLRWPGAAVEPGTERIGRHHLGVRARLSWYRMFYVGRHRA
ncbi:MAG TPA: hypothetical protein VH373_10470 [Jatrophihabitantaceae bacterium]|jgi:hypothetical protein